MMVKTLRKKNEFDEFVLLIHAVSLRSSVVVNLSLQELVAIWRNFDIICSSVSRSSVRFKMALR